MDKSMTGTIFKFKIPYGLGVGYAKLIDLSHLSMYNGIILNIYDYFEDINIKDLRFFENFALFMNPIPITKMPSVRGKFAWKKLGVLKEKRDDDIPIYKKFDGNGFGWDTLKAYEEEEWFALINLNDKIGPLKFNQVRHLEELYLRSTVTIERRVAIQILRYRQVDVKSFMAANEREASWEVDYNTQQFIPLYKQIPEEIRGRPLIQGWVPNEYLNYTWRE